MVVRAIAWLCPIASVVLAPFGERLNVLFRCRLWLSCCSSYAAGNPILSLDETANRTIPGFIVRVLTGEIPRPPRGLRRADTAVFEVGTRVGG